MLLESTENNVCENIKNYFVKILIILLLIFVYNVQSYYVLKTHPEKNKNQMTECMNPYGAFSFVYHIKSRKMLLDGFFEMLPTFFFPIPLRSAIEILYSINNKFYCKSVHKCKIFMTQLNFSLNV